MDMQAYTLDFSHLSLYFCRHYSTRLGVNKTDIEPAHLNKLLTYTQTPVRRPRHQTSLILLIKASFFLHISVKTKIFANAIDGITRQY